MKMKPFTENSTKSVIDSQHGKILFRIDNLDKEDALTDDVKPIVEQLYKEYYIEPVTLQEEDVDSREKKLGKVMKKLDYMYDDPYEKDYIAERTGKDYIYVDSYIIGAHFPFEGNDAIFHCRGTSIYVRQYPEIDLKSGEIILTVSIPFSDIKHGPGEGGEEELSEKVKEAISKVEHDVQIGLSFSNKDISDYNDGLESFIRENLKAKKQEVERYMECSKLLDAI